MESALKVGFVGLGIMGAPMAANLLKTGFPVSVYNRTPSKCLPLIQFGGAKCESLADMASGSDVP